MGTNEIMRVSQSFFDIQRASKRLQCFFLNVHSLYVCIFWWRYFSQNRNISRFSFSYLITATLWSQPFQKRYYISKMFFFFFICFLCVCVFQSSNPQNTFLPFSAYVVLSYEDSKVCGTHSGKPQIFVKTCLCFFLRLCLFSLCQNCFSSLWSTQTQKGIFSTRKRIFARVEKSMTKVLPLVLCPRPFLECERCYWLRSGSQKGLLWLCGGQRRKVSYLARFFFWHNQHYVFCVEGAVIFPRKSVQSPLFCGLTNTPFFSKGPFPPVNPFKHLVGGASGEDGKNAHFFFSTTKYEWIQFQSGMRMHILVWKEDPFSSLQLWIECGPGVPLCCHWKTVTRCIAFPNFPNKCPFLYSSPVLLK